MEKHCYLGRGIDVVYASAPTNRYLKRNILKEVFIDKNNFHSLNNTTYDVQEVINSSLYETIKSVEIDANVDIKFAAFSGGLEHKYSRKQGLSAYHKYCRIEAIRLQSKFYLEDIPSKLALQLDPLCSRALNDKSICPEDIFDIYGTHLIAAYRSGAKMQILAEYQSDVAVSDRELSTALKLNLVGICSVNASEEEQATYNRIMDRTNIRVNCIGGEAATSFSLFTAKDFQKNVTKWANSLKNLEFSIAQIDRYIPIWILAENVERQQQLEQAFKDRIKKREKEIIDFCAPLKTGYYKVRIPSTEDLILSTRHPLQKGVTIAVHIHELRFSWLHISPFKFTRAENGTYKITHESKTMIPGAYNDSYVPIFIAEDCKKNESIWEVIQLTDRFYRIKWKSGSTERYLSFTGSKSYPSLYLAEKNMNNQVFELVYMGEE